MEQQHLMGVPDLDMYLVLGVLVFFGLLETITGHLKGTKRTFSDWIQEAGGMLVLSVVIKPGIVLAVYYAGHALFPEYQTYLYNVPIWQTLLVFLLVDDFLQYWYHRLSHVIPFFWKLHRPHHQAEEMGYFVSYRNAFMYYVLMPNIWWMALVTAFGGGLGVGIGLVMKQVVIISSHSLLKWDEPMYKSPILRPFVFALERIIVTPAFHHAHHGKSQVDGVSDPNGNFGNMFSIWDQIFGSAKFTHRFPTDYGLPNDPKESWLAAYFYPIVASKDPKSELSRGYHKGKTTSPEPAVVELHKGDSYLYCQCGLSGDQPFCDGSHHGTNYKPIRFEAKRTGTVKLCNCKLTKTPPYCDNSHRALLPHVEPEKVAEQRS